jgi:acyl-CoA thioesterase
METVMHSLAHLFGGLLLAVALIAPTLTCSANPMPPSTIAAAAARTT